MKLSDRVKYKMMEIGMTQAELAAKSGLSTAMVSEIVNGNRADIRLGTARKLAFGLGINASYFVDEDLTAHVKRVKKKI